MPLIRDDDEERQARIENMFAVARETHAMAAEAYADAVLGVKQSAQKVTDAQAAIKRAERRLKDIRNKARRARRSTDD